MIFGQEQSPLKVHGFMLEESKLNAPGLVTQEDPERLFTERTTETMLGILNLQLGNK